MQRPLAQLMATYLPADRRKLVDEHDLPRHLSVGEGLRDELPQLGTGLLGSCGGVLRYDERTHEVAALLQVSDADDGGRRDRRMAVEHALDVVRSEGAAAARDDVFGATDEREVALVVHVRDVSGQVPVAEESRLRLLRQLPVAREQGGRPAPHGEVALDPGRKLVALVVDDANVMTRHGPPEGARLDRSVGEVRDHDVRLGLAVTVGDGHAPALLEDRDDLRVEEVAGRNEPPEAGRPEAFELGVLGERTVFGRGLAEDARAEPEEQIEPLVGVERAVLEDDLGATRPRADDGVPHRERRRALGRAPDGVAAADVQPVLGLDAGREGGSVGVRDVFARAAHTACRDDEREVARGGVVRWHVDGNVL